MRCGRLNERWTLRPVPLPKKKKIPDRCFDQGSTEEHLNPEVP